MAVMSPVESGANAAPESSHMRSGWQVLPTHCWFLLVVLAMTNLASGLVVFNRLDFQLMHRWTSEWLWHGVNLYAGESFTDYPPNAIVTLAPLALLPLVPSAWLWAFFNIALATAAPVVAAKAVRDDARAADIALLTLTFLCWSATRSLLQYSLLTVVFGVLAWRLADRRPWVAGMLLGLAVMKPQAALPFCLWVVFTGRWRLILPSVLTVVMLWLAYCARVGAAPLTVAADYLAIMREMYAGAYQQVGHSEFARLAPAGSADLWRMLTALVTFGLIITTIIPQLLRAPHNREGLSPLPALPGMVAAAVLITFRHLSYAFVALLPAAAWLLLDDEPTSKAARRRAFWVMQCGLIVDVPTVGRLLERLGMPPGSLGTVLGHADRIFLVACLLGLVTLQWVSATQGDTEPARTAPKPAARRTARRSQASED